MAETSQAGKKWSQEEHQQLLEELEKKIDITEIAMIHKRNYGGIKSRINGIAYKMYNDKVSLDVIYEKTGVDKEELEEYIKREASRQKMNNDKRKNALIKHTSVKQTLEKRVAELETQVKDLVFLLHRRNIL